MDPEVAIAVVTAIATAVNAVAVIVLVVVTQSYARSTGQMVKRLEEQSSVLELSAEISARAALTQLPMIAGNSATVLDELAKELARRRSG